MPRKRISRPNLRSKSHLFSYKRKNLLLNLSFYSPRDNVTCTTVFYPYETQMLHHELLQTTAYDTARVIANKEEAHDLFAKSKWCETWKSVNLSDLKSKCTQSPDLLNKLLFSGCAHFATIEAYALWSGNAFWQIAKLRELLMRISEELRSKMTVVSIVSREDVSEIRESASETKSFMNDLYEEAQARSLVTQMKEREYAWKQTLSIVRQESERKIIEKTLNSFSPFLFLSPDMKSKLLEQAVLVTEEAGTVLISPKISEHDTFILVQGKALATDDDNATNDILLPGASFGIEASLFGKRQYTVTTLTDDCLLVRINPQLLIDCIEPGTQFAQAVARSMTHKQHLLDDLQNFKTFVLSQSRTGSIDIRQVVKLYRKIGSPLHPLCEKDELDINAWKYALHRLPENITNTFSYVFTDKFPDILSHSEVALPINSSGRARFIFQVMPGKSVVLLRELETDLLDFISNLCIHIVESRKLRHKISSPKFLHDLMCGGALTQLPLSSREIEGLKKLWTTNCQGIIAEVLLHHEDYKLLVEVKRPHVKQDPGERWTARVWDKCAECLDISGISIGEAVAQGLKVDIIQGSTRTTLAYFSPYMYMKAKEIDAWFSASGLTLKTKDLKNDQDRLMAMAYYYFLNNPDEAEKRIQVEREFGIIRMNETEFTGVRVVLINTKKLPKEFCDPAIHPEMNFPMHLIVNIGYTFGSQAADIMRSLAFLFGSAIRSVNVIGKAGGLTGSRSDIVIANKFYNETTNEIITTNPEGLDTNSLMEIAGTPVRLGPMLTVTGTILQNEMLLKHYKVLLGCVALEMEGCYLAKELKKGQEAGFLQKNIASRFLYYISDLPLEPNSSLSMEDSVVCWDEGIASLNALARFIFKLILDESKTSSPIDTSLSSTLTAFAATDARPVVLISSGGTSVLLEANVDRVLENFLSGKRGAISAESFIAQGYRVIFLTRTGSLQPYLRLTASENLLELPIEAVGARVEGAVLAYKSAIERKDLLIVPFTTVVDYLCALELTFNVLKPLQTRVILYLAAAVSDYYLPSASVNAYKTKSGNFQLDLYVLPVKKLALAKSICPGAFLVCFTLKTAESELLKACKKAVYQYQVDCIVGNLIYPEENEVVLCDKSGHSIVRKSETDIEDSIVQAVVAKHRRHLE